MNKINKIFTLLLLLIILAAAVSGISTYLGSSVNLGISDMEGKVFDLQVKLRNLTTGDLLDSIRGWEEKKLQESFAKLSPPTITYAFGIDYLNAFLASSGNVTFAQGDVQNVKFPDISLVGMSVKKGIAALTLNVQGTVQMWMFKYENGNWKTQDAGYLVEDISITKDQVSFVLSVMGQKKKYVFPIAVVPAQYATP